MKEIRDKESGKKMYPVGKFLTYQHVFYNAVDRACCKIYDIEDGIIDGDIDEAYEWKEKCEDLLTKFDCNPQDANGIVYMLYEDYKIAKDIIGAYAWRHNGYV